MSADATTIARASRAAGVLLAALALESPVAAAAGEFRLGDLTIRQPWARASAGPARAGVVYLTIVNSGAAPDRLLRIASPAAKRASLHESVMRGGVMSMRPVEAAGIAPGATVELKPGGLHVMLMGLTAPLRKGDSFPLSLTFEKAGSVDVEVEVLKPGSMGPGKDSGR